MGVPALTLTLPPRLAVVEITLDTSPPLVTVTADPSVDAPNVWEATLRSTEDICGVELAFVDAAGVLHSVGAEAVNARTLRVQVPTVALWGPARLTGWVSDCACNRALVDVPVTIVRTEPFDVEIVIGHAVGVSLSTGPAFDADTEIGGAFDTDEGVDHAYETEAEVIGAFDVEVTISE